MRKLKPSSPLFLFLKERELLRLSKNDPRLIAAKKEYRKFYLLEKKRTYRAKNTSVTIVFSEEEFDNLKRFSKEWDIKYPSLIKQIITSYIQERSIIIQPHIILEIRSLYFKIIRTLETLNKKGGFRIFSSIDIDTAIAELHQFQNEVKELLENPHHKKS